MAESVSEDTAELDESRDRAVKKEALSSKCGRVLRQLPVCFICAGWIAALLIARWLETPISAGSQSNEYEIKMEMEG